MNLNYTNPSDPDHVDQPEDWLLGALLFSKTLGLIFPENRGVVVDLEGDMLKIYPAAKRVIVASRDKQIVVINADERTDLNEGDWVELFFPTEN